MASMDPGSELEWMEDKLKGTTDYSGWNDLVHSLDPFLIDVDMDLIVNEKFEEFDHPELDDFLTER